MCNFLRVVTTGLMDEHWMPAHQLCSLCSQAIQYDFVIKYENLKMEQQYFGERLKIDKIVLNRWENKNIATNYTTAEVRLQNFNNLISFYMLCPLRFGMNISRC